jgi:hypothetical protein
MSARIEFEISVDAVAANELDMEALIEERIRIKQMVRASVSRIVAAASLAAELQALILRMTT